MVKRGTFLNEINKVKTHELHDQGTSLNFSHQVAISRASSRLDRESPPPAVGEG